MKKVFVAYLSVLLLVFSIALPVTVHAMEIEKTTADVTLNVNTDSTFDLYVNTTIEDKMLKDLNGVLRVISSENETVMNGSIYGNLSEEAVNELMSGYTEAPKHIVQDAFIVGNSTDFHLTFNVTVEEFSELKIRIDVVSVADNRSHVTVNFYSKEYLDKMTPEQVQNVTTLVTMIQTMWPQYKPIIIQSLENMNITVYDIDIQASISSDMKYAIITAVLDIEMDIGDILSASSGMMVPGFPGVSMPTPTPPFQGGLGKGPIPAVIPPSLFGTWSYRIRMSSEYSNGFLTCKVNGDIEGLSGIPILMQDMDGNVFGVIVTEISVKLTKGHDDEKIVVDAHVSGYTIDSEKLFRAIFRELRRAEMEYEDVIINWHFGGTTKPKIVNGNVTFTTPEVISALKMAKNR
ncbi:MAG: hypothetical protein DRN26_04050, partial [Thermoplasmata archaeon]